MKGCWVLTFEVNDYDQHGEYFLGVFSKEPSIEELAKFCSENKIYIGHDIASGITFLERLKKGGGRTKDMEGQWYNLTYVKWQNS